MKTPGKHAETKADGTKKRDPGRVLPFSPEKVQGVERVNEQDDFPDK